MAARFAALERGCTMRYWLTLIAAASLLGLVPRSANAIGPIIDWDPAYAWQAGATPTNLPAGGEFKMVGIISGFGAPFDFLDATDPTKEYTFYVHGLISQGTVASGDPSTTVYTTDYDYGTIEIYEDTSPDAVFDPYPPNANVPSTFIDGTPILTGSFTSFVVQSNNFTAYDVGNIEGDINFTGGTLYQYTLANGGYPCPGLLTGGSTWYQNVLIAGYLFRHDGKIDLQCPTDAKPSTWGRVKTLYR